MSTKPKKRKRVSLNNPYVAPCPFCGYMWPKVSIGDLNPFLLDSKNNNWPVMQAHVMCPSCLLETAMSFAVNPDFSAKHTKKSLKKAMKQKVLALWNSRYN